jgi:hypothetical protein
MPDDEEDAMDEMQMTIRRATRPSRHAAGGEAAQPIAGTPGKRSGSARAGTSLDERPMTTPPPTRRRRRAMLSQLQGMIDSVATQARTGRPAVGARRRARRGRRGPAGPFAHPAADATADASEQLASSRRELGRRAAAKAAEEATASDGTRPAASPIAEAEDDVPTSRWRRGPPRLSGRPATLRRPAIPGDRAPAADILSRHERPPIVLLGDPRSA